MHAEQRRRRAVLLLGGLLHLTLRRYRCPQCGAWRGPGAEELPLRPRQRLRRSAEEGLCGFGLSWSYQAAATSLARVLPGLAVSARTVERATKRGAGAREAQEEVMAQAVLEGGGSGRWGPPRGATSA
jgi:hypothetical protein